MPRRPVPCPASPLPLPLLPAGTLKLGVRDHHGLLGLLASTLEVGFALLLGNLGLDAGIRELRLHRRLGLRLSQGPLLLGGGLLPFVGLELLDRKLPNAEL